MWSLLPWGRWCPVTAMWSNLCHKCHLRCRAKCLNRPWSWLQAAPWVSIVEILWCIIERNTFWCQAVWLSVVWGLPFFFFFFPLSALEHDLLRHGFWGCMRNEYAAFRKATLRDTQPRASQQGSLWILLAHFLREWSLQNIYVDFLLVR